MLEFRGCSANKYYQGDWPATSETLCLSLFLTIISFGGQVFPVHTVVIFCHFPQHKQLQFIARREMQRKREIIIIIIKQQTNPNKNTTHKAFKLAAHTHYNSK